MLGQLSIGRPLPLITMGYLPPIPKTKRRMMSIRVYHSWPSSIHKTNLLWIAPS